MINSKSKSILVGKPYVWLIYTFRSSIAIEIKIRKYGRQNMYQDLIVLMRRKQTDARVDRPVH